MPEPPRLAPVPQGAASLPSAPARDRSLRRLEYWLDDCFRVPFTRWRFGLDQLIGLLLPGLGDVLGFAAGAPILIAAVRRRHPWRVVLVMLVNLLLDAVLGTVPLAGDAFDFLWKANRKNLALLEDPQAMGPILREARWKLIVLGVLAAGLIVLLMVILAVSLWIVLGWLLPAGER